MRSEGYSSCLCVCVSGTILGLQATRRASVPQGLENDVAILLKPLRSGDMASKEAKKPICIMSTGLPRTRLARSALRGRMMLLRGYVAVQRYSEPTHDHAAN